MHAFFVRSLWLSLLIALLIPSAAFAQTFPDVPENTRYYGATEYLKAKGVISGYPDGTFKPEQTINRAEALKMVMIASATSSVHEDTGFSFPDVGKDDWFYEFVQKALTREIVEGYEDGYFRPATNINIAESLKIIFLSFDADLGETPTEDPYPDVGISTWYADYANYAKSRQFIWPLEDGKLHADREITRGEFADIIYRFMYTEDNSLEKFPLSTDWQTYSDSHEGYLVKYPYTWDRITAADQTIFWHKDEENHQLSWARMYPNGATLVIAVDDNEDSLSLQQYLALIEYDSSALIQSQTLNGYPFTSVYMDDTSTFDYYFEMPNGKILVVYSQVGEGHYKAYLVEEIRNIIGSIRHFEGSSSEGVTITDEEQFLSQIRENILVEGEAGNMLQLFDDAILIETDTIGIGTGPVDYYYSSVHDVTLKIERNSDTILAISEEKSTAF